MPKILARGTIDYTGSIVEGQEPFYKTAFKFDKPYLCEVALRRSSIHPSMVLTIQAGDGEESFDFDNSQEESGKTFKFSFVSDVITIINYWNSVQIGPPDADTNFTTIFDYTIVALTD